MSSLRLTNCIRLDHTSELKQSRKRGSKNSFRMRSCYGCTMITFAFLLFKSPSSFVSSFSHHTVTTCRTPIWFKSRLFATKNGYNSGKNLPLQNVPYTADLTTSIGGYNRPIINWYPGHIAKAEILLSETLKAVDIVVEVRDSRAPKSTAHPRVAEWSGGKPRIVVLTKVDLIPKRNVSMWKRWGEKHGGFTWGKEEQVNLQVQNKAMQAWNERQKYADSRTLEKLKKKNVQKSSTNKQNVATQIEEMHFIDAKRGQGIHAIHRAIWKAGQHVNERRARRGLSDRALRVGVIGYPNVGKSALINRILGRKRARSSNTPGITRSLQWIRVRSTGSNKKEFELLDSPGIIPANMFEQQSDAMLLAACNSIGTGAYDNQAVSAYFLEWVKTLHIMGKHELSAPHFRAKFLERYGFDPLVPVSVETDVFGVEVGDGEIPEKRLMTGEDMLFRIAEKTCRGDPENAARKILQDFRTGRLGQIALQFAPETIDEDVSVEYDVEMNMKRGIVDYSALVGGGLDREGWEEQKKRQEEEIIERANVAKELAGKKGLELPPVVMDEEGEGGSSEVGKGMFDGW